MRAPSIVNLLIADHGGELEILETEVVLAAIHLVVAAARAIGSLMQWPIASGD
jgi:hypothetical protein